MNNNPLIAPAPLVSIAKDLNTGKLNLLEYIDEVCDHLDTVDPQVQAFLPEQNRRARLHRDIETLMKRYPTANSRPPLYGIPVGIKDMFRVDGFPTQAGSQLPTDVFKAAESICIQKLRAAGVLILGKTVTTEFAFFEPGPTHNPHNLEHTPGGSSSGSAAAVAAGLTPLALGTQTIGSIIRPAAFCGVVGFKPSYGRIDSKGVIYIAPSLDHVGMFTQDVDGMRLAAASLIDGWRMVKAKPLEVLGVPEGAYLEQVSPEGLEAFEAQVKKLEGAGFTIRRVAALDDIVEMSEQHRALMSGEMAQVHANWFPRYESLYRPRTTAFIRDGLQVNAEKIKSVREMQLQVRNDIRKQMHEAQIDLWIAPSAKGGAPKGLEMTGDPAMSYPWTFAGMPTISLPAGFTSDGLPLGLQCIGAFGQDEVMLVWAKSVADVLLRQ
jgi:Asp-tRNA(Asn)/Glu-tRNA(Gln) amidotransferase A subunit family amidase